MIVKKRKTDHFWTEGKRCDIIAFAWKHSLCLNGSMRTRSLMDRTEASDAFNAGSIPVECRILRRDRFWSRRFFTVLQFCTGKYPAYIMFVRPDLSPVNLLHIKLCSFFLFCSWNDKRETEVVHYSWFLHANPICFFQNLTIVLEFYLPYTVQWSLTKIWRLLAVPVVSSWPQRHFVRISGFYIFIWNREIPAGRCGAALIQHTSDCC